MHLNWASSIHLSKAQVLQYLKIKCLGLSLLSRNQTLRVWLGTLFGK